MGEVTVPVDRLDQPSTTTTGSTDLGDDTVTEILLAVFREVLSVERVEPDSRFYALGGDSLTALRVVAEARARGVPIALRDLLVHQTVAGLVGARPARHPERATEPQRRQPFGLLDAADRALLPEGVVDALPASALQVGMLYLCEVSQDPMLYHVAGGWEVCAPFAEDTFRTALTRLTDRHPALRTSFDLGGLSLPTQLVWPRGAATLTVEHATDDAHADTLVRRWLDRQLGTPVDWAVPALVRWHVVVLPTSFRVVVTAHHTVLDGWSFSRLGVDLMMLYDAALSGREPDLPATAPDVHQDFLVLERQAAASATAEAHWLAQANGPEPLLGWGTPGRIADPRERYAFRLDRETVRSLTGVARMLGVSVKSVTLAAHARALGTWAGRDHDVVTGLVFNTRPARVGTDLVTGLFLNTLPVRFATVDTTWANLVRAASDAERDSAPYQAFPQARLVEILGRPAFDVTFNFMNFHAQQDIDRLERLPTRSWWRQGKPSFPFHVNVEIVGAEGQVRIGFDSAFVARDAVEAYAGMLRDALAALLANPVSPAAPTRIGG